MARCATSRKAARLERNTKVSRVDDGRAPIAGGDARNRSAKRLLRISFE